MLLRRIYTLFTAPSFSLDVSLSSRFSGVSHTKAGALGKVCADTDAEDEEDAFPSLLMFVPDSARVGMLSDGFLPRGARKSAT